MITPLTPVSAKTIQHAQRVSEATSFRTLRAIKKSLGVPVVLVAHLAAYWKIDAVDLVNQLQSI